MKYQKQLALVGAVALGVGALWYLRKVLSENPADISGVTATTKSGPTGALTTTPIKLGDVAFVAANSTLDTLASIPARALSGFRSLFIPARIDARQPFGNTGSAAAAFTTNRNQLAANYNPKGSAFNF